MKRQGGLIYDVLNYSTIPKRLSLTHGETTLVMAFVERIMGKCVEWRHRTKEE